MNETMLKYIALYLPQYHTFKENDEWWGTGFTEWTNVKPAEPFFDGHYQPHEPVDELGYYDLSNPTVMEKQAQIAKQYGIYGFCYYYYWFDGRTLMEKPLENMLNNPKVDIPFCLCWANHNWTRRWDGMDHEILIEQTYDENTYTRFIDDISKYFQDERYIKINNKPVILIYQAEHIKNPKKVVKVWRNYAQTKYNTELYLVCVHQSSCTNVNDFGYDAAVDFTPTWRANDAIPEEKPTLYNPKNKSIFVDYRKSTLLSILRKKEKYKIFNCVYMMWDNSPRRKEDGAIILLDSKVEYFEEFLIESTKDTIENFAPEERFLFINAWNEWGEGVHLEPCKKFGYTYLEICHKILNTPINELLKLGLDKKTKGILSEIINENQNIIFNDKECLHVKSSEKGYRDTKYNFRIKFIKDTRLILKVQKKV